MNVTITPGITFNMTEKKNWELLQTHLGWEEDEIENIINILYGSNNDAIAEIKRKYQITPEQSQSMFIQLSQDYIKKVNNAIKEYRISSEESPYIYTQNQLEAMFDVAYNQGLENEDINKTFKIIHFYLGNDKLGAVDAVETYWEEMDPRRRINQMHLFFYGGYDFKEDFSDYKIELGFKE